MNDSYPNTRSWNFDSWFGRDIRCIRRVFRQKKTALTHIKDLSSSDRYKVTEAHRALIHISLRYWKFRMRGKYTSSIQDLRTITGQSLKEDSSLEVPAIAEEGKHSSFQLWTRWRSHCPISKNSEDEPRMVH